MHIRRDRHLGINAVVYALAVIWETRHTVHHLNACVPLSEPADADTEIAA